MACARIAFENEEERQTGEDKQAIGIVRLGLAGRRLGYPLKLVTTKAHLFLRWEDDKERFNLEATGKGMNRYDDEHFKRWPFLITEAEIQSERYLKSLTPPEEFAVFLSVRGMCLCEAGRMEEAA